MKKNLKNEKKNQKNYKINKILIITMKGDIRPLNGHSISFAVNAQATQGNFCQGDKTIIKNRAQFRGCQWAMTPPNTNKQPFGLFFSIFFFIFFV